LGSNTAHQLSNVEIVPKVLSLPPALILNTLTHEGITPLLIFLFLALPQSLGLLEL